MAHSDLYLLFIEYFNEGNFFSAQKTIDQVWVRTTGDDKNFYAGLSQLTVALYHLTNGDLRDADKSYRKARNLLLPYGEDHQGISLKGLLGELDRLYDEQIKISETVHGLLSSEAPSGQKKRFDYRNLIPQIVLKTDKE